MHYLIYTDGAYYPDIERSAISYVMLSSSPRKEVRRHYTTIKGETCTRAELKAIISGIYALPDDATACTVISDSKACVYACNRYKSRLNNLDLWALYDKIVESKNITVTPQWVRSHNGNFYNELCDVLCTQAINEYKEKKLKE